MSEYMNEQRPALIPVKPGGEPAAVLVRLVRMDGTEMLKPGRSVRYSGSSHVMVAVGTPPEYLWLRAEDVTRTG